MNDCYVNNITKSLYLFFPSVKEKQKFRLDKHVFRVIIIFYIINSIRQKCRNFIWKKQFFPYNPAVLEIIIVFMKIERNALPESIVELIIEADAKEVAKQRTKVFSYLRENGNVKGFRKGAKIPDDVLEKNYGANYINQMTVEYAIDVLYKEALKKEKIVPVAQAEIKEIISQSPLKIRMHIEVLPEVTIKDGYKKIKLKKKKLSVSAEEVKAALADIETRFTRFNEVEDTKKKAKIGDKLTIDTDGYDSTWELLESTSMKDYPLVLGSNMLVPGFEDGLVWVTLGAKKELDIEFPKDYHNADFAGKKTKFKVTVKKFEQAQKPEFTPEFIQQLRGKDLDLKGFKELIKEELLETKTMNAQMEQEMQLIDELLKVTTLEVGKRLLAGQIEKVYAEIKENMSRDNVNMGHYLESLKLSEEEYKEKNVQPTALKRLQGELILNKLSQMEKTDVSDEEMKKEIEKVMSRFESPDVLERLKELYVPGTKYYEELKMRITYRKLIDSFFEENGKA